MAMIEMSIENYNIGLYINQHYMSRFNPLFYMSYSNKYLYNITTGAIMATKDYKDMSTSEKKKEDWMNTKWRPMMGWMYMAVCMADFVLFPVLWSLIQASHGGQVHTQWNPITLQGAGLFHMAMGAILGIAVYGRTQEKMCGVTAGGIASPASTIAKPTTTYVAPAPTYTAPVAVAGTSSIAAGKARPVEPDYPAL
jgi:hypothetical protein